MNTPRTNHELPLVPHPQPLSREGRGELREPALPADFGNNADRTESLLAQVRAALDGGIPLEITGGRSKDCYGRPVPGMTLDTRGHRGIVNYDPSELVVTARAGTPLSEIVETLEASGQMLACEAPDFTGTATIGGTMAAGLSGPRRPWAGSVRDFVLGCRVITGEGKHLRFGGQVIKNVAGYDVSRLMAGSLGCLGLITEVSLKVLPLPRAKAYLRLDMDRATAQKKFAEWGRQSLPISGAAHDGQAAYVRLEGGEGSVKAARLALGGEEVCGGFWPALRDHKLPFFQDARPLWRLSVAAHRAAHAWPGDSLADWGGAQVWLKSDADAEAIRAQAQAAGGHATCFTPGRADSPFAPLPHGLMALHKQLKARLDPQGIFNPGRMYAGL